MNTLTIISILTHDALRRARRQRHLPVLIVVALAVAGGTGYLTFFGSTRYEQFLFHIMMLALPVLSVVTAVLSGAWMLPQYIQSHTVHLVLARPVRRWHVVAGNFIGALLTSLGSYIVFAGIFLAAFWWRGVPFPPATWHAVLLLAVQVAFFTALSQCFSLLTTPLMTVTVCILYFFIGQLVQPTLAATLAAGSILSEPLAWLAYIALPHINYFNLTAAVVHQWPAVAFMRLLPVVCYGTGWTLLLLLCTVWRFERCEL